jgi:hypothetical protein
MMALGPQIIAAMSVDGDGSWMKDAGEGAVGTPPGGIVASVVREDVGNYVVTFSEDVPRSKCAFLPMSRHGLNCWTSQNSLREHRLEFRDNEGNNVDTGWHLVVVRFAN